MLYSKRATLKDIAEAVGVSSRAVSYALNDTGRLSAELRRRIRRVAGEMNYQPNIMARGLVQKKTYLLGALFPYVRVSFFNEIISGIERSCTDHGYDLLLGNASLLHAPEEPHALKRLVNRNVDGILCAPDPRAYALFRPFVEERMPVVQVMTRIPDLDLPYVGVDNEHGGYVATRHLIELGHRRIAFLASDRSWYAEINDRYRGYTRALLEAGVRMDPARYRAMCDLTPDGAMRATGDLLANAPETTAIFVPTDHAAIGAVRSCLEAGLSVPEDCSVVGYDDLELAELQIGYPLTTVTQPKERVGVLAFDLFRAASEGLPVESILLKPELVVRNTTSPSRDA
ncbi:MAG: LacI family transcriptional regulator [Spirochaetales bacterium]|nr:LacI family transcriptional regulator [Spirochaetales bacterium]